MAYNISLTIVTLAGNAVSINFESFTLDRHFDVLEEKVVDGTGHEKIIRLPGRFFTGIVTLTRRMDKASSVFQDLFRKIEDGGVAATRSTAVLSFSDPNGIRLVSYTLTEAWISSLIALGNQHGGNAPEEEIQITYDEATVAFG